MLKNRGYNLEHNFGHGKQFASEIFLLLNLLAFQFHTMLIVIPEAKLRIAVVYIDSVVMYQYILKGEKL